MCRPCGAPRRGWQPGDAAAEHDGLVSGPVDHRCRLPCRLIYRGAACADVVLGLQTGFCSVPLRDAQRCSGAAPYTSRSHSHATMRSTPWDR
jgi:hypothetical protein